MNRRRQMRANGLLSPALSSLGGGEGESNSGDLCYRRGAALRSLRSEGMACITKMRLSARVRHGSTLTALDRLHNA